MNVTLTPQPEALISQKVASGRYTNASEVVREALRLLEERDCRELLRAAIAIGDEQFARGEFVVWSTDTMRELIQEAEAEDRKGLPIRDDVLP